MKDKNSQQLKYHRPFLCGTLLVAAGLLPPLSTPVFAQYLVTDLVSNQNAIGTNPADPALINAWGITSTATSPVLARRQRHGGYPTLYNSIGQKSKLVVTVPAVGGSTAPGTPTGVIANATGQFNITVTTPTATITASPIFIFATQDGTIRGWNPKLDATHAIVAVDHSGNRRELYRVGDRQQPESQ